ncbi:MAG: aminoacyl-tRNA hydrolase [Ilumatobacteraceae bacterium]
MSLFGRAARRERQGTPFDYLIVGVGNPGREYVGSRHNVGFEVIDILTQRNNVKLKSSRDRALISEVQNSDGNLILATPTTFMNDSGEAVGAVARRYEITDPNKVIIVHDELDLEPGVVRIKVGGGLAGHNGLRSIAKYLKTQEFVRVRIGVGKPLSKDSGASHVLSRVPVDERKLLDIAVHVAADAVQLIYGRGLDLAMQQINSL